MATANSTALHGAGQLAAFYDDLLTGGFFVFEPEQPYFQEKLLHVIWNEQLVHGELTTADGQPLRVVHRGVWNVEAGPDFREAVLTIAGESRRGAVEIHLQPELWERHGHTSDPAYREVVLHVVWRNPAGHRHYPLGTPLLVLHDQLRVPLPTILESVNLALYPYARQVPPAPVAEHLAAMSDEFLRDLFQSYGVARILQQAETLCTEVTALGLEETAYRRLLDILGYKNNRRPFAELAAAVPVSRLAALDDESALALLCGAAGFLPDPAQQPPLPRHRDRVRRLWQRWWLHRDAHRPIVWQRGGQRPYNAPERRLIAAWLLLRRHRGGLGQAIIDAFLADDDPVAGRHRLATLFRLDPHPDWEAFFTFEADLEQPAALLGESRLADLIVNLALPLFFAHCLLHQRPDLCHRGKAILRRLPRLQQNRRFAEASHQLFAPPGRARQVITNACAQQGLLKLYRDWQPG